MIVKARALGTVRERERERERELHFSEIEYSFIKHRLKEDSGKNLF